MLNGWIWLAPTKARADVGHRRRVAATDPKPVPWICYSHIVINQELVVFVCGEDTHILNMDCIPRIRYVYLLLKQWPFPICIWYAPRVPVYYPFSLLFLRRPQRFRDFSSLPRSCFFLALGFQFLFCIEYQSQLFRLIYMVRQLMKASWDTLPPLTTDLKVFSNWNQLRVGWVDDDPIQHANFHIHFSYFHEHLVPPRNSNHYSRLISQVKHLVMSNL